MGGRSNTHPTPQDQHALSQRDGAALRLIASTPGGRVSSRRSGMERGQWRRAVASLLARCLVVRASTGDHVAGEPDGYDITPLGRSTLDRPTPGPVAAHPPGPHLDDLDSSTLRINELEQDPSSTVGRGPTPGPAHPGPPPHEVALAMDATRAMGMERLNVVVTHVLAPESIDALAALLMSQRNSKPERPPAAPTPGLSPDGCPRCGAPLEPRERGSDGTAFLGCSTWRETGCKGSRSLGEAYHRTSETSSDAARKARDEHAAKVKDEREAQRAAEAKAHADRNAALLAQRNGHRRYTQEALGG